MEESKDPVKPWERPWSTEEMRQQSGNWNLAGDAGLLKHLQEFSQNLLAQTHATEVALDSLMEQLRATSTDVSNVTNQFLCLANTQFVENRVYDDDEKETPPEEKKEEEKPKTKEEQEAEVVARIREALAVGMSVLDTMFDAVEVPGSDSEDEESGSRVVLEPRNPYLSRPLPYLIGSKEFMEDDNVGLGSLSDSEEMGADRNRAQSSESESEMDIEQKDFPKKRTRLSSTSASENTEYGGNEDSEIGPGPGKQKKTDNSLFGNIPAADTGDMFGGDSPTPDEIGVVDDGSMKRNTFAAELAAKLGGVAAEAGTSSQPAPKFKNSDSKPSMEWEEDEDGGLFGRRDIKQPGGLFDDLEDSPGSLWNTKEKPTDNASVPKEPSLFGPDDDNEDTENGIFSGAAGNQESRNRVYKPLIPGVNTSTPIVGDSGFLDERKDSDIFNYTKKSSFFDGDLDEGNLFDVPKPEFKDSGKGNDEPAKPEAKEKKPVGGVSVMFGSADAFKSGIRRPPSSSSCSSDESPKIHNKALRFDESQPSGSSAKISSDHHTTVSKGAATKENRKEISLFDNNDDNLFEPISTTRQGPPRLSNVEPINSEPPVASSLFEDEPSDSLFSKPQKASTRSSKPATGASSSAKQSSASRKPNSLFNDSDSGDDELLFSSTSSTSSRSRRSQGSGDLLASSGDKIKPPVIQKKGLFGNEDELFGGMKDDPGFDIFSTGTNTTKQISKGNLNIGDDLFQNGEDNSEYNIFKNPSMAPSASISTKQDKIKKDNKDTLFGDDANDTFDIFGGGTSIKIQKNVSQNIDKSKIDSLKGNDSTKTSGGLFSDDVVDDIFAIPINSAQKGPVISKVIVVDDLFGGNSVINNDDLFSEPVIPKKEDKISPNISVFNDQTDDVFSVPKMPKNQVHSKDNSNSDVLSKSSSSANDIFDEKSKEKTDIISSNVSNDEKDRNNSNLFDNNTAGKTGITSSNVTNDEKDRNNSNLFDNNTAGKTDITSSNVSDDEKDRNNSNLFDNNTTGKIDIISSNISNDEKDRNNSNLFDNITAGPPLSKKPVIASKPIIKQKPKVPSTPKPSLFKNSPEESDVFSSDKKPPQTSKTVKEQEKIEDSVSSKNEIATKPDENNLSIPQLEERVCAKDPSPPQPPTKPEPPKTLNIRKTTGLLFSSSSNEDEDLFGLSFPGKSSLNSSSVEADENAPPILESLNDEKPKTFSTEKRSRSDKEISSKLESSQEQNGSSIIKARSVGASPKQLNIDPMALLPGAKPPPRGQHNAEVAVGFDRPAQLTATLHSAGKERARIQTKRRPPTRKARQEAIRKSGLDFDGFGVSTGIDVESTASNTSLPAAKEVTDIPVSNTQASSENIKSPPPPPDSTSANKSNSSSFVDGSSNLLSPSTDEEDLFGVPQDLPLEYENSKDDGQSLFSTAPVLSPLEFKSESLPRFPEEDSSISASRKENSESVVKDENVPSAIQHTENISKDLSDKTNFQTDKQNLLSENIIVPNDTSDVYDHFRNAPPLDDFEDEDDDDDDEDSSDLFSNSKKKTSPPRKTNEDLFASSKENDNLFSNLKSTTKVDIMDHSLNKTEPSSNIRNLDSSSRVSLLSENDPLSNINESKPSFLDIPKSDSQDELFSSSSAKHTSDLFSSKKSSGENVNDMFLPPESYNPLSYGEEDDNDLFSTGANALISKDNKNRTSVEKSNIFDSNKKNSMDVDELFSSGKQYQFSPPEDDLFSTKEVNSQKTATPEKKLNADLFGGDSPEGDDLFFSTSSKKKVVGTATKAKPNVVSGQSVKGSLFDEDEDGDDIFGGRLKSSVINKPSSVPINEEGSLFASGSIKKKNETKMNKSAASSNPSHQTKNDEDLFEDPLMVVSRK